jgi:hypothetical protein
LLGGEPPENAADGAGIQEMAVQGNVALVWPNAVEHVYPAGRRGPVRLEGGLTAKPTPPTADKPTPYQFRSLPRPLCPI